MTTSGDRLFELFCSHQGIRCVRIAESTTKRPDYKIDVGGQRIFTEVKTLEPNADERAINARRAGGEIVVGGGIPGERLRRSIRTANSQLKSIAAGTGCATLLAVFNNTDCTIHTDPYSVMTAMQGLDVIEVSLAADPAIRPAFGPTRSGPGREMRRGVNTSTSAIAVLCERAPEDVTLLVYHNRYAAVPLQHDVLRIAGVRQFRLPDAINNSLDAQWSEF